MERQVQDSFSGLETQATKDQEKVGKGGARID